MVQGSDISSRIRAHIRSHVVGYIALFVALSGTAYAVDGPLAGQDTVGSADIINGEVLNQDLGADAVGSGKIIDDAVQSRDVRDDTLDGGGLSATDLRPESVGGSELAAGSVSGGLGGDVNDNSLIGADVADTGSLGTEEIGEDDLFNDNSLNSGDVADTGSLGTAEINEGSLFNDNSLIGADINESQLSNPVPLAQDAGTLDGLDSTEFVQGQTGGGEVGLGRAVQAAGSGTRILLRGNLGSLVSDCQSDGDARLRYVNSLVSPAVDIADNIGGSTHNIGGSTQYTGNLATGASFFVLDAQAPESAAVGQIQVHTAASTTGPQEAVTFLASAEAAFNANDSCKFMGQVLHTDS